jgi:hypothetical protein
MADTMEAAGALVTAGLVADALDHGAPGHAAHPAHCANCGTALAGEFCSQCGQRAHLHRTLGEVFHEFLHGITHFDGKAWKTLPMLVFRPGVLIRSYIDGHRARYIAPVPTFLLVVFTMFFVLSFLSVRDTIGIVNDGNGPGMEAALAGIDRDLAAARAAGDTAEVRRLQGARNVVIGLNADGSDGPGIIERVAGEIAAANARGEANIDLGNEKLNVKAKAALNNPGLMLYKLQTKAYKLSFLLVPLSLPWLWLAFLWKRGVGMYDHAIFTLYSISFMSLLFIVGSLLLSADIVSEFLWVPLLLAPGAHLFASLRGAYALGPFSAAWRTVYLSAAAMATLSLYLVILIVLGVLD